jgi:hypothetical protein
MAYWPIDTIRPIEGPQREYSLLLQSKAYWPIDTIQPIILAH